MSRPHFYWIKHNFEFFNKEFYTRFFHYDLFSIHNKVSITTSGFDISRLFIKLRQPLEILYFTILFVESRQLVYTGIEKIFPINIKK